MVDTDEYTHCDTFNVCHLIVDTCDIFYIPGCSFRGGTREGAGSGTKIFTRIYAGCCIQKRDGKDQK